MTAADLIRARRNALGLSLAELAARAGTGQAFVSRVESGRTTPTLPVLQGVCEVVSPSSKNHDRRIKAEIYARARIPVYLIVDPTQGLWEVFVLGPAGSYQLVAKGGFGDPCELPSPTGTVTVDTGAWRTYA